MYIHISSRINGSQTDEGNHATLEVRVKLRMAKAMLVLNYIWNQQEK